MVGALHRDPLAAKAQQKAWRGANAERLKARKREYYRANRERELEKRRKYRAANREKVLRGKLRYREANRERLAAEARAYFQEHKEERNEYHRRLRRDDPERIRGWGRQARANAPAREERENAKSSLARSLGVPRCCIDKDVVEAKVAQRAVVRVIREMRSRKGSINGPSSPTFSGVTDNG